MQRPIRSLSRTARASCSSGRWAGNVPEISFRVSSMTPLSPFSSFDTRCVRSSSVPPRAISSLSCSWAIAASSMSSALAFSAAFASFARPSARCASSSRRAFSIASAATAPSEDRTAISCGV